MRNHATIQAEIDVLQEELATTQPASLTLDNDNETGKLTFAHFGAREFAVNGGRMGSSDAYIGYFTAADADALRDWLNYHFPKTEETTNA